MSAEEQEELVGLFRSSKISRRQFIRRLMAGGVSLAAALAYTESLAPPTGAATVRKTKPKKTPPDPAAELRNRLHHVGERVEHRLDQIEDRFENRLHHLHHRH